MYRILIVDDEKEIRTGLATQIPWDTWEIRSVMTADDGDTALELVEAHEFDIIFTDMKMNRVSGVELVTRLYRDAGFTGKVVVISGYDDFQYAKNMMQLGVADYLLKPVQKDELARVVSQTLELIRDERLRRHNMELWQSSYRQSLPRMREELLTELIERPYSVSLEARLADRLGKYGLDWLITSRFMVAVLEIDDLKAITHGKPESEKDLLLFAVGNVAEQSLLEMVPQEYVLFRTRGDRWAALIRTERTDAASAQEELKLWMGQLQSHIRQYVKVSVSIGVSPPGGVDRVQAMFASAADSIDFQKVYGLSSDGQPDDESLTGVDALQNPEHVLELLKFGADEEIRRACGEFPGLVRSWGVSNPADMQQRTFEWLLKVFQLAKASGWKELWWEKNPIQLWDALEQFDTVESMREYVLEQLSRVAAGVQTQFEAQSQIAYQAEQFITAHFSDNLTLQMVADHVHVTPVWLSKLFKKEKGATFLEYVTELRLKKAKTLLQEVNLRVYQVCEMVGYQDTVHFSKLFKKKYGYTPKEYRNMRGIYHE